MVAMLAMWSESIWLTWETMPGRSWLRMMRVGSSPEKEASMPSMALTRMPTLEKWTASHWVKLEMAAFAPE